MLRLEEAMPDLDPFDFGEFSWPSGSDDLFDTSGSWTGHALLDWQRDTVTGRQEGFRRSAEILVDHVLKHRGDLDFLIYPIANNWRHHIELSLKSLLVALYRLRDEPANPPRGHDLLRLWEKARPMLEAAFPDEPADDAENVDRVLCQLHAADPGGQDFRYHRRADGRLALEGIDRLDVRAMHDALIRVSNFLDGAAERVWYDLDVKDDLDRELRRDYGP
jgi:hypothetical protein